MQFNSRHGSIAPILEEGRRASVRIGEFVRERTAD